MPLLSSHSCCSCCCRCSSAEEEPAAVAADFLLRWGVAAAAGRDTRELYNGIITYGQIMWMKKTDKDRHRKKLEFAKLWGSGFLLSNKYQERKSIIAAPTVALLSARIARVGTASRRILETFLVGDVHALWDQLRLVSKLF